MTRPYRRDPEATPREEESEADTFCRLACLTWTEDDPAYREQARRLLAEHPRLDDSLAAAAAAASDPGAVARHLAADPGAAGADSGPHGWPPLLYLTYSRLDPGVRLEPVLATARLLLDAGADPDAGLLWQGLVPPFTALTGAFGEGEQGPHRQLRHPHSLALAGMLLAAGADPNDGQTLYNRMFLPDDDHLVLLLEHGLGRGDGGVWKRRVGDAQATPAEMLAEQVEWALERGFRDRLAILLAAGAPAPSLDDAQWLGFDVLAGDAAAVDVRLGGDPRLADQLRVRSPVRSLPTLAIPLIT